MTNQPKIAKPPKLAKPPKIKKPAAGSLLENYDDTKATHTMSCWTGPTGLFKYEIKGKEIHVNNNKVADVLEQKGDVFAGKFKVGSGGNYLEYTIILDYKNKKATQKAPALGALGLKKFDCN